jgi:hypothetical protein
MAIARKGLAIINSLNWGQNDEGAAGCAKCRPIYCAWALKRRTNGLARDIPHFFVKKFLVAFPEDPRIVLLPPGTMD